MSSLMMCPLCKGLASWNTYFNTYKCSHCDWQSKDQYMKAKIISSDWDGNWYKEMIGEIIDVYKTHVEHPMYTEAYALVGGGGRWLAPQDLELIQEEVQEQRSEPLKKTINLRR